MKALALLAALAGLVLIPAAARAATATPPTPGALYRDGQSGRYLLGGTWLFQSDPSDVGLAQRWQDSTASTGWSAVSVPNAWNAGDYSAASMLGGIAWYRRDFTLPAGAFPAYVPAAARRWIVRFESVNYKATVWLNGHLLGAHTGAYLPFEFDLTHLHSGVNHLVVRVDSVHGPGDLPGGPENGWWNFGGLLREVYLRSVAEADIAQVQVRTLQSCFSAKCPATIDEVVTVRNPTGTPQTVSLAGRFGSLPLGFGPPRKIARGATWTAHARATLAHPQLWAPGHPFLYRAVLSLSDAKGRALGGYVSYSGVRTIAVTADGRLTLNGRLLNLRGVNLHEQDPSEGAAISTATIVHLIDSARLLGATLIRAHYPLNPQLEELADRDGVLLWSEIPAYGDNPFLGDPAWRRKAYSVLAANIATNQNHPSVMLWSIGNEPPTPPTGGERVYIAAATALAHQLDPTRPVGIALSTWPGVACQAAYAPLDVLGVNDYFGWYDAGGGGTDDRDALSSFLDSFRACYPTKAVMITEFGFEADRAGPVEERGTYAFQAQSAAFHLDVFATKRWLSGALYFALQDFAVTPGWTGGNPWPDPPFLHKGLLDLNGAPKPAFAVVARIFHRTVQIAPAHRT
ncbi:MAG TPA: glycoside hydrolase family 2 TIM barrel-domain containing protein [Solirubrobacteraceae bacterium]|nr:glycoside hydrolase family 2 TIM barrel-domain containing protein [Solirubrobacteraceae bacterium]